MSLAEIHNLPLHEKLRIFEALWDDFAAKAEETPLSQEEQELLDSRIQRLHCGEARVFDWDTVKHSLGR